MNNFSSFITAFAAQYGKGLPGRKGQLAMKPYVGFAKNWDFPINRLAKKGAVYALFYPKDDEVYICLMQRPNYNGTHGGQISFPGGKIESSDDNDLYAALREMEEEVGVVPESVSTIGKLTEVYVVASNFLVYPFVGYTTERPNFKIDKREVEALMEVPFTHFLNRLLFKEKKIKSKTGFMLNAPYFDIEGKTLWGATAMMLSEIVSIYEGNPLTL